jgi:hypothetical protein
MSQLVYSLGAINKNTGKYVYAKIANKKDEYICLDCNNDLILCQGEIRIHHFRHKVDTFNPCHYYSNPTETQIHNDSKMLMKKLLENKTPIQYVRECISCKKSVKLNLPDITEDSIISLEHRFNYNNKIKIADVAHIINGEIKSIYEMYNTHKTYSENRPEPWVEIDAKTLIFLVNNHEENTPLIIKCIRREKCEICIKYDEKQKIKKDRSQCYACGGSGTSYWSDDCYDSCLECCCMNCSEFNDECQCNYCEKCEIIYMKDEKHNCDLCCDKYEHTQPNTL